MLHIDFSNILAWIGTVSVRTSIFILLLTPVMLILRNKLRARLHYLVWCLVLISLLLPRTPASPLSIYNLSDPGAMLPALTEPSNPRFSDDSSLNVPNNNGNPVSDLNQGTPSPSHSDSPYYPSGAVNGNDPNVSGNQSPTERLSPTPSQQHAGATYWLPLLFLLWLTGTAAMMFFTLVANRRFAAKIHGQPVTDGKVLAAYQEAWQELFRPEKQSPIPLLRTSAVKTPSLFGVFRPKLLLPAHGLAELSDEQLRYVFIHELLHFKRKDIFILWLARILLALHWFNPLVWYAFRKIREYQEPACDEAVLSRIGPERMTAYGLTLIRLLENCASSRFRLVNATSLSGSKSQLKKRISLLRQFGKASVKWTIPVSLLILVIALVTLSSAMGGTTVPAGKASPADPLANTLIEVNSTDPVTLNMDWVEKAKSWEDIPEFAVTNESDIASIACGELLGSINNNLVHYQRYYPDIDWTKIAPVQPLFIKSYEWSTPDYYLVPFVQDGKFAADAVVSVLRDSQGTVRYEYGGPIDFVARNTTEDRFLAMDIEQAMQLIRKETGRAEVPVPRLVYHSDLTAFAGEKYKPDLASREPAWEFILPDGSRLYVAQSGQVMARDILPWYEKLPTVPYNPENTKITANTLQRDDGWSLTVEQIELSRPYTFDPVLQGINIHCRAESSIGPEHLFMPQGTIVGITTTDGQTHPVSPRALDALNISLQQLRLEGHGMPGLSPGRITFSYSAELDTESDDTEFSALLYRDEHGNDYRIPLSLAPVRSESVQKAQLSDNTPVEPSLVPGKDWGFAITTLAFRWGNWTDQKVAFFELNVLSAKGPDKAFTPTGAITGIIGSSGKFYRYDGPETLEGIYRTRQAYFQEKGRPMYQAGVIKITPEILVDADEAYVAKVVYRDENGQEYQIPLQEVKP